MSIIHPLMDPTVYRKGSQFLMEISYFGNKFFGIQRLAKRTTPTTLTNYDDTIQMSLEIGLNQLKPLPTNHIETYLLSRTDSGVHALQNYATTILEHPEWPMKDFHPEDVSSTVNYFFNKMGHEIRIKKVHKLPTTLYPFQKCHWREYAYRFVLIRSHLKSRSFILPASIRSRISVFRPFDNYLEPDIDKMSECLKMYEGLHNFKSFEQEQSNRAYLTRTNKEWLRNPVQDVSRSEVNPLTLKGLKEAGFNHDLFEIRIRGTAFLYRQVRRMVGIAFMYACGRISKDKVMFMLDNPHHWNWQFEYFQAPPDGLYLAGVRLSEEIENILSQPQVVTQVNQWLIVVSLKNTTETCKDG